LKGTPFWFPLETIQLLYETFFDTWPPELLEVIDSDDSPCTDKIQSLDIVLRWSITIVKHIDISRQGILSTSLRSKDNISRFLQPSRSLDGPRMFGRALQQGVLSTDPMNGNTYLNIARFPKLVARIIY